MNPRSDIIMIKKPDGTFEEVRVDRDVVQSGLPAASKQPMSAGESDKLDKKEEKIAELPAPSLKEKQAKPALQQKSKPVKKPVQKPEPEPVMTSDDSVDWDSLVRAVISEVSVELFDETAERRFFTIVLSRLRDVRDWLQTKEALTRDRELGGIGLSEADAAHVLNVIESKHRKLHRDTSTTTGPADAVAPGIEDVYQSKVALEALSAVDVPAGVTDNYADVLSEHIGGTAKQPEATKPDIESLEQPVQQKTQAVSHPPAFQQPPKAPIEPAMEQKPIALKRPEVSPLQAEKPTPSMQDVTAKRRLVGPLEELQNMRLADFRRLGADTQERLRKITEIVASLEDESFSKKVQGIKGWRQSPLYEMYVSLGRMSLSNSKPVKDIIQGNEQSGKETMTYDEFEQITDFNKRLRY